MPSLWVGSWEWGGGWGAGCQEVQKSGAPSACPRGLCGCEHRGLGPHALVAELTTLGLRLPVEHLTLAGSRWPGKEPKPHGAARADRLRSVAKHRHEAVCWPQQQDPHSILRVPWQPTSVIQDFRSMRGEKGCDWS